MTDQIAIDDCYQRIPDDAEPGDAWMRAPLTEEDKQLGPDGAGWAVVFVYLGEGGMLTFCDDGTWDVHPNPELFVFDGLEQLPR